jgi:hypothetical protein
VKPVLKNRIPGVLALAVVLAAVSFGLSIIGPPGVQREKKLDARRISDLQLIAASIDLFYSRHGELPESLVMLEKEPGGRTNISDPQTGAAYFYTRISLVSYRLCARFSRESGSNEARTVWAHNAGEFCFQLTAKKLAIP